MSLRSPDSDSTRAPTPDLTDNDDSDLSDGTVDRQLSAKFLPAITEFDFSLLDIFSRTPGKGRRIAIIVLNGEEAGFLLPLERKLLVQRYECPAIILYARSDEMMSQYFIESYCKDDATTDSEPFKTSDGVLALNYLLDKADAKFDDRKAGRHTRSFLGGAKDFVAINYPQQHYVQLEKCLVDDWFEIVAYRAGCNTASDDRTMGYRRVHLSNSTIIDANFPDELRKDISRNPVFVHQFGVIGFTLINLYSIHNFNHIKAGIPDGLVEEELYISVNKDNEKRFKGNKAGTIFFYLSPRLSEERTNNENNNELLFDLYEVQAKIVAPFPDDPSIGAAATTLAANLALYLSEHDILYKENHERELNIGDHRISKFLMRLDSVNSTKNQECRVEVVVETEVDALLKIKITELKFGAPITFVKREMMEVSRRCMSADFNFWDVGFRRAGEVDDYFGPISDFGGDGVGGLPSLCRKERHYLARLFKEVLGP
ncbi:075c6984-ed28-4de7-be85-a876610b4873 [Sclerotinia trifoliorum]|uniref:075c6984-ed28-4de7-be85-a876610b4873 n=1 Tax=Sclerotinia trifoliorum TaxID=28548 RepID=A0A8H2ZNW1_9HELO|nr:075c6984-ed28-4de7-be85-a876610b4873 [Sclerotinia trifoliorum]